MTPEDVKYWLNADPPQGLPPLRPRNPEMDAIVAGIHASPAFTVANAAKAVSQRMDKVGRCQHIMNLVDDYHERPNSGTRYAIRSALMDCFSEANEVAKDAERYRCIRNPPYSDRHGDLYAMTFQGDGDVPLKGDALDVAADDAIGRKS